MESPPLDPNDLVKAVKSLRNTASQITNDSYMVNSLEALQSAQEVLSAVEEKLLQHVERDAGTGLPVLRPPEFSVVTSASGQEVVPSKKRPCSSLETHVQRRKRLKPREGRGNDTNMLGVVDNSEGLAGKRPSDNGHQRPTKRRQVILNDGRPKETLVSELQSLLEQLLSLPLPCPQSAWHLGPLEESATLSLISDMDVNSKEFVLIHEDLVYLSLGIPRSWTARHKLEHPGNWMLLATAVYVLARKTGIDVEEILPTLHPIPFRKLTPQIRNVKIPPKLDTIALGGYSVDSTSLKDLMDGQKLDDLISRWTSLGPKQWYSS